MQNVLLYDGFPLTVLQAEKLDDLLEMNNTELDVVVEHGIDDNQLVRCSTGPIHLTSGWCLPYPITDDVTREPLMR